MAMPEPEAGRLIGDTHILPLRVYWEDTDAGGIVYHASFLRFAERGRTETVRALGIDQRALREEQGQALAVSRMVIDYQAPARLGDALVVETRPTAISGARLNLAQRIATADRSLVTIAAEIACLDSRGRAVRLPPALVRAIAPLLDSDTLAV